MRLWRNWHTRTFEGRVRKGMGSSPINRTIKKQCIDRLTTMHCFLFKDNKFYKLCLFHRA